MSLKANLKKRYFPSFKEIQQKILNEQNKTNTQKVKELEMKVESLKGAFDLQDQHEKIKKQLLQNYHSMNQDFIKRIIGQLNDDEQKLEKQNIADEWNKNRSKYDNQNSSSNNYSLNYCIDEDIEEDNHYQNHLKFKKQVLERDLFQNQYAKIDKKKQQNEQFIFKNLYNPRPNSAFKYSSVQKRIPPKKVQNNFILSQNSKEFIKNVQLHKKNYSQSYLNKKSCSNFNSIKSPQIIKEKQKKSSSNKCVRKKFQQDQFIEQHIICNKNTKTLKDNYGKYLKDLSGTNIIKWRILGGNNKNESINPSINSTASGIKKQDRKQYS